MLIYNYSGITGEFLGHEIAEESPLEPGVFLFPANSTLTPPPDAIDGKKRCFVNGSWEYVSIFNEPENSDDVEENKTQEQILAELTWEIQKFMDIKCHERLYDGILSLCTYASSQNPKFKAEGQAGVNWRDACWSRGYEIMAEVQQGLRPIPTEQELLGELPALVWPDEVISG